MKLVSLFLATFFTLCTTLLAQQVNITGVDNDGYIGVYEIGGQKYWWLCIEPNSTPGAGFGDQFEANQVSFQAGWDQQNTERQIDYNGDAIAQAALPKQIAVMQYVLDSYLPIATLTTPGALLDGSESSAHYGNNESFYNSLYAVQHFLTEVYGKTHSDFSAVLAFDNRWDGDLSDAGIARSDLFEDILADVASKNDLFFATYNVQNSYYVANTLFSENNTNPNDPDFNWQDALIIVAPVPEPSGALLIGCCGLAVMFRRWRRLA